MIPRAILPALAAALLSSSALVGGPPITMQIGEDVPTTRFQIVERWTASGSLKNCVLETAIFW